MTNTRRVSVLAVAVVLLGAARDAGAQGAPAPAGIQGGVKIGAALTFLSNPWVLSEDRDDEGYPAVGPEGGVWLGLQKNAVLGVQVEVAYTLKTAMLPDANVSDDTNDERRLKIGYVEVPLLLKLTAPGSQSKSLYFMIGPSLGFRVKARLHEGAERLDIRDRTESLAWNGVAALGLQSKRWQFEARFAEGLSHIAIEDDKGSVKFRTFSLLVGRRF